VIAAIRHLPCARHTANLVEYAEQRVLTADAAAALVHAERCARCARELQATLLVVAQLRRLASGAGVPAAGGGAGGLKACAPDHWAVVRRRIAATRETRASWSNPFMGPLLAAGVLAAVLAWGGHAIPSAGPATDWEGRTTGAGSVVVAIPESLSGNGGDRSAPVGDAPNAHRPIYEPPLRQETGPASGPALEPARDPQEPTDDTRPAVSPRATSFEAL